MNNCLVDHHTPREWGEGGEGKGVVGAKAYNSGTVTRNVLTDRCNVMGTYYNGFHKEAF